MTSYRNDLNRQWVEDCMRQRNESGKRDCEDGDTADFTSAWEERESIRQLFTDMQPDLYHSPLKRQFEQANAALKPLTGQNDLVGELARTRHDLNDETLRYLNRQFTGDLPGARRICIPMPCVFRFTEFEIKKPEKWEENAENRAGFQLRAPLFPAR
ncbi:MAG: hypothetical protein RQ899_13890 [Pseudomonadales bacterium]|nr:hypothetical protein [Pseudomonadales bacterium]